MKQTISIFTALIIFATAFSLSPFCPNANAQIPDDEKLTSEEQAEKQEVQKFVDSFLQSLDETKDLDKVPEKFFVADFKTRFAQNKEFSSNDELLLQLSAGERYEYNVLLFNFFHLGMMYFAGTSEFKDDSDGDSDKGENEDYGKKMLAPEALKIVEKSKILQFWFGEDFDLEAKNIIELQDFIKDLKKVVEAQRKYLNERSVKWKEKSIQNLPKVKKKIFGKINDYGADFCEGNECEGLPEKTRIFYSRATLPLALKIVKENGELKILNLNPVGN